MAELSILLQSFNRHNLTHLRGLYLPKLLILSSCLFYGQKIPLRSMIFFELVVVPFSCFLKFQDIDL